MIIIVKRIIINTLVIRRAVKFLIKPNLNELDSVGNLFVRLWLCLEHRSTDGREKQRSTGHQKSNPTLSIVYGFSDASAIFKRTRDHARGKDPIAKKKKRQNVPAADKFSDRMTKTKSGIFMRPYRPVRRLSSTMMPRWYAMLGT